jgi:SAM-dependent methyltransferase
MTTDRTITSPLNGSLWGRSAADWAAIQEGQCRLVYERVFAQTGVAPGVSYLDVGCGAGMAIQIAASLGATVSGLDASEPLLAIARARTPTADLHQGELEALPFSADTFDLVTSFNAVQYAADPTRALGELRRVARPGATVVLMTWGDPVGMPAAQLVGALKPLLPPLPPGAPGPFALSDKIVLKDFATGAGLVPVEILDVDCPWQYPDLSTALRGLNSSGVSARARDHSGPEAVDRAHEEALRHFHQPDGSYHIGATFRCLFTIA